MGLSRAVETDPPARTGSSAGRDSGTRTRRRRHTFRAAVLDAAALVGRLAAAWIATSWALEAFEGGTRADLLAGAVLACAAAFAAGLAAPLSGVLLAAAAPLAAFSPVPPNAGAETLAGPPPVAAAGAAPWWLALTAVCLLGALVPGRLCADRLVARRRGGARTRTRGAEAGRDRPRRIARRPEEAPPLPYPGDGAALKRPSRI